MEDVELPAKLFLLEQLWLSLSSQVEAEPGVELWLCL